MITKDRNADVEEEWSKDGGGAEGNEYRVQ